MLKRYSRILIPLPPVQSVKDEVTKLIKDIFKITPEYVETDWFEGYAISWGAWYGFEDFLKFPSMRSFFPLRIKRIIDDWLDSDEEDMQVVEWIDEDKWEWLDVVKDSDELFHGRYEYYDSSVRVTDSNTLWIKRDLTHSANYVFKKNIPELMKPEYYSKVWPIFKVLARRGYWNTENIEAGQKDKFYEKIGYKFGEF